MNRKEQTVDRVVARSLPLTNHSSNLSCSICRFVILKRLTRVEQFASAQSLHKLMIDVDRSGSLENEYIASIEIEQTQR